MVRQVSETILVAIRQRIKNTFLEDARGHFRRFQHYTVILQTGSVGLPFRLLNFTRERFYLADQVRFGRLRRQTIGYLVPVRRKSTDQLELIYWVTEIAFIKKETGVNS